MLHKLSNSPIFLIVLSILASIYFGFLGFELESTYSFTEGHHSFLPLRLDLAFWANYLIGISLGIVSLTIFQRINEEHKLVEGSKRIMILFFLLFSSFYPTAFLQIYSLLSLLLGVFMLQLLLRIYNQKSVLGLLFGNSLLIGIACIFFYPAALFLLLTFIATAIFRAFAFRNFLISLLGFLLPFLYLFSFSYLLEYEINIPRISYLSRIETPIIEVNVHFIGMSFLVLLGLLASMKVLLAKNKLVVRQRNQLIVLFLYIVCTVIVWIIVPVENVILFLLLPISLFFMAFYQDQKRKWILDIVLVLLLGLSILDHNSF